MEKLITLVERGAEDRQGITTAMLRPRRGSRLTGSLGNAASVAAAMLPDSIGIVIPVAK